LGCEACDRLLVGGGQNKCHMGFSMPTMLFS
jgi:hypothetical protein